MQNTRPALKATPAAAPEKPLKLGKPARPGKPSRDADGKVSGTQLWLVLLKAFHSLMAFTEHTLRDSGL
ncbi:MAG TPA: hypothetical protein VM865_02895, partial [Acidobacteriaceae bacterium]|nr:hypothetical protein [Acidobacteriaceae bacterium]